MANGVINSNGAGKAGKAFRQVAAPAESRTMKSIAAFLGGMLLFAFSGAANVATVYAHGGPSAPSTADAEAFERQYPDATSLRVMKGPDNRTGLHEGAETGTLATLKASIVKDLRPEDLGRLDGTPTIRERVEKTGQMVEKPNPGRRRVIDLFMNPFARFANPEMRALVRAYSETLDAEAQSKLASMAVDSKVLDMVSISKLGPEHIIKPVETRIPLPPEVKTVAGTDAKKDPTEGTERFRIIKTNLLLDALHASQNTPELQALADRLTPAQMKLALEATDEFGGTLAHYWAQDRNVEALVRAKTDIDWSAPDNAKVTPLEILANSPEAFSAVFGEDDPQLAAAVAHPANRKAMENLVTSHRILQHSNEIIHAVVTPAFLLSASTSGVGNVASQLKPECLVAYFSPRVMGHWTVAERRAVWAEIKPEYKHITEVRDAYRNVMLSAMAPQGPSLSAKALN